MTTDHPSDPLDLRHAATDRATIVVVPERRLFAIDGIGDPRGADYPLAAAALRTAGEHLAAGLRRERSIQTRIGALETVWWIHPEEPPERMAEAFGDRSSWHWQQMIEIPKQATYLEAETAIDQARQEATRDVALIRVITLAEGRAAQILHVGARATEPDAVRRLYNAVAEVGLERRGHLHQIFLADPDRVPAERTGSIMRLPVGVP